MVISTPIRVLAVAVALSTLSFAAGVAGDLSMVEPPRSGERVVLRLPPELPANTPRAAPIVSTAAAVAAEPRAMRIVRRQPSIVAMEKLGSAPASDAPKPDPDRAPKPESGADRRKGG